LRDDGELRLSEADAHLLDGKPGAAAEAYRKIIINSADPNSDAWIGLSLALHQLPVSPIRTVFADQLPLMFDIHVCLGDRVDPLDLAWWLA
jgi:hypothetical protein